MVCANTITLRRNVNVDFPKQFALLSDKTEFVRVFGEKEEIIKCPIGLVFNNEDLHCSTNFQYERMYNISPDCCPDHFEGLVPNPMECSSFINCWNGSAFIQNCPTDQLFSNTTGRCTYPQDANCCEYWEKDSSKIVM